MVLYYQKGLCQHKFQYHSGHWLFGFASKKYNPVEDLKADEWNKLGIKTKYYNTELHKGSFALPNYVKELINEK
jgi:spermidine synthase